MREFLGVRVSGEGGHCCCCPLCLCACGTVLGFNLFDVLLNVDIAGRTRRVVEEEKRREVELLYRFY